MMLPAKKYIGESFIGKTLHFKCDCVVPIDEIGTVKSYTINSAEVILLVEISNRKIIHIGLNAPSLLIEDV